MKLAPPPAVAGEGKGGTRLDPAGQRLELASSYRFAQAAGALQRGPGRAGMKQPLRRGGLPGEEQRGGDQRAAGMVQFCAGLAGPLACRVAAVIIAPAAMAMP